MKDVSKSKKNSRTVMVAVDIDAVDVTEGSPGNGSVPMSLSSTELSQAPGAGDKKRKSRKQSPKLQPTSEFDLVMFKARKQYVGEEERHIKVTVMRYGSCSSPATVNYETRDGDAEAGADYVAIAGTLTFEPGEDKKQIEVDMIDTPGWETTEHFFVRIFNIRGLASLGFLSETCVYIIDDDRYPSEREFTNTSTLMIEFLKERLESFPLEY